MSFKESKGRSTSNPSDNIKFNRMTTLDMGQPSSQNFFESGSINLSSSMSIKGPSQKKLNRMTTQSESQSQSFSMSQDFGNNSKLQILPSLLQDNGLPETFDEKAVKQNEEKFCEICYIQWSVAIRRHHCRRCGLSVCNKCSANQKALSKSDQKNLYRICDACDTELQNYKLKNNQDEIIKAQEDHIQVMTDNIERMDDKIGELRDQYEKEKKDLQENLQKKWKKKEELEKEVEQLRRDLERLNNTRNMLYQTIGNDERLLKERENEKNKLINQKSVRLTDLAEKEKILHDKEQKNEELRKLLESQKQKFRKSQGGDNDEELKISMISNGNGGTQIVDEEQVRLDRMRTDKFKYIMDSMANHRIDETASEYSASFLSENAQINKIGSGVGNRYESYYNRKSKDKKDLSVMEEEEEESMSSSRNMGHKKKSNKKDKKKSASFVSEDKESEEGVKIPRIKKKK